MATARLRLQCSAMYNDGARCKAYAQVNGLCASHDPEAKERRRATRQHNLEHSVLSLAEEVRAALRSALARLADNTMEPERALAVVEVVKAILSTLEERRQ